jgi:hypothetical protein
LATLENFMGVGQLHPGKIRHRAGFRILGNLAPRVGSPYWAMVKFQTRSSQGGRMFVK